MKTLVKKLNQKLSVDFMDPMKF